VKRRVVEIRGLNLKPGSRWSDPCRCCGARKMDVVSFGPSPQDQTSYYVIRAYADLAERQASEDAFYGSDDWKKGPREALLSLIESYTDVVLELDEPTIAALRRGG